jgi:membrane associated rhomboid family serine protease
VSLDELESHFLDDENWMTDKKTRLWDIRINSRRPNQYSLTSRLIFANVAMFALQASNPRVTGWGVKLSDKILNGQELYRLLSPVFLHGGIYHLFTNMYSCEFPPS